MKHIWLGLGTALLVGVPALSATGKNGEPGAVKASAKQPSGPVAGQAAVSRKADRAEALLARMSLEHKVAQIIMPDISTITPADVEKYRFGTILNGGNSGPGGNDLADAKAWLDLADAMWAASVKPLPGGEPAIPLLWGTDAVHGHNNIRGATFFPHNIALGAANDVGLARRIGAATAAEIAVTGIDWTFAPTLAVVTDPRWGRTYESFSQDPGIVSRLGAATIEGLQGKAGTRGFLDQKRVIATAKHFFGDGGTGGKDRGDTRGSADELARTHAAPYPPAIAAGVQTVMASFSSVNGVKMHGNKPLLTGTLRGEMGFMGPVVGDWNGHGELAGCTNTDCPQSLMAGLDIYMVPEDWRGLYANVLAQVRDGRIPMARLDEAVLRVLRLKEAYGLFGKPRPAARKLAGKWSLLGAPAHRALAREAVRKSLVLLKNNGVLPIKASANVVVAGSAADSIARQSGGWSLTWQGGGSLTNADFPGATSIYAGIAEAVRAGGGTARLASSGEAGAKPDVAIVVFGEQPYAEFVGDREDLALRDEEGLALLRQYKAAGVPTVAVLLAGRPLWMERESALADAFVVAWLPGSEGAGVADVLIGNAKGRPRHDFTGRLPFDWPSSCQPNGAPLFRLGWGSSYALPSPERRGEAECSLLNRDFAKGLRIFERGLAEDVNAAAVIGQQRYPLPNLVGGEAEQGVLLRAFDRSAQEDARRLEWRSGGAVALTWPERKLPAAGAVSIRIKIDAVPTGPVRLVPECADCADAAGVDLTSSLTLASGKDWRTIEVPLACLGKLPVRGLRLESAKAVRIDIDRIGINAEAIQTGCNPPY